MYGHAAETLTACSLCPPWEPRWATAVNDADLPVCTPHAVATMPELSIAR